MSNKLQLLLQQMWQNAENIDDICQSSEEFYFKYKSRQFSIQRRDTGAKFYFFVYPNWRRDSEMLAALYDTGDSEHVQFVSYQDSELDDPSVLETLYTAVKEKALNLDDLFDEILD